MSYFLMRLNSPRPTFPQDITPEELAVMQAHAGYWRDLAQKGTALIVGPVADPARTWGVAIVQADDAAAARAISDHDPAITGGIGFTADIFAMPRPILRPGI